MNTRPLAKLLVNKPKIILIIFTIITVIVGAQATNVYMTSNLTGFLPKDDPTIILWNRIYDEFQLGSTIIIYVEAPDIRDPDVLQEMERISKKINWYENDKGDQDGVFSIKSIAELVKDENSKPEIVGGFGGTSSNKVPDDEDLIARYVARTQVQSMKGILFTNTYRVGVIIIQLDDDADYQEVLDRTEYAVENGGNYFSDMSVTGTIAMQYAVQKSSMTNLFIIFPIALLLVSAVLFYFHRSAKGIIIAFLPPAFAMALTFGVLGVVQPELTIISIAVVALLLGLGVDYSIHIMNRFGEEKTIEEKIERMDKTLKSTGKAVLLSTVTTMIGFGSLMISSMSPIVTFGFACAIGILFCFISAIIIVPCLVIILKFEKNGYSSSWKKFARFAVDNRKRILVLACFFLVMSLIVLPQIKTDVDYMEMVPEGIPEVEKLLEYSDNFGSGANFNAILIETDPQGLTYPETIETIYNMEEEIRKEGVAVYSIADEIKETNDILERKTIINKFNEIFGFEEIIFDMIARQGIVDKDFSKTFISVSIPLGKSIEEIEEIVNNVNRVSSRTVLPHNGRVYQLTGQDAVNVAINKKLSDEQTRSMIIALLLVLAALIVIFNSSLYGALTMIPVAFVLIWEPGFLVSLDIPLSVVTISIASIMIGIGIDYGIHITQRVREGLAEGKSKEAATRIAIEKTGLSLVEAAGTTTAGLVSIYFVNIPALQEFGLVIIIMTVLSCVAAALILPAFYFLKPVK